MCSKSAQHKKAHPRRDIFAKVFGRDIVYRYRCIDVYTHIYIYICIYISYGPTFNPLGKPWSIDQTWLGESRILTWVVHWETNPRDFWDWRRLTLKDSQLLSVLKALSSLVSISRSARCRYRLAYFRLPVPVPCSFHVSLHFPQRQGLGSVQNLSKASDVLAVCLFDLQFHSLHIHRHRNLVQTLLQGQRAAHLRP